MLDTAEAAEGVLKAWSSLAAASKASSRHPEGPMNGTPSDHSGRYCAAKAMGTG